VDNSAHTWAPRWALVVLAWLGTVAALTFVLVSTDKPGQILLGVAALVLAGLAAYGTVIRPRLMADSSGITVRTLSGREHLPWARISVRLVHRRRLGRDLASIEVDVREPDTEDEGLLVFGWLDLGADPVDVAEVLRELRT